MGRREIKTVTLKACEMAKDWEALLANEKSERQAKSTRLENSYTILQMDIRTNNLPSLMAYLSVAE